MIQNNIVVTCYYFVRIVFPSVSQVDLVFSCCVVAVVVAV